MLQSLTQTKMMVSPQTDSIKDSAAQTEFVQAGMVTHHLVSIAPTRPEFLNSTSLNGFKIDLKVISINMYILVLPINT